MRKDYTLLLLITFFLSVNVLSAQVQFTIGDGEFETFSQDPSPVNIYYESIRLQIVYKKEDLNSAGAYNGFISKLGFYVIEEALSKPIPNYSIKIKETDAPDASLHDDEGLTEVYFTNVYEPTGNGFDVITLDEPFLWSGEKNLLIDICFGVVDGFVSEGRIKYDISDNAMRYIRNDNINVCADPTTTIVDILPQLFLEFEPSADIDAGVVSLVSPVNFCAGENDVIVKVANFGNNEITEIDVNWTLDGTLQPTTVYTEPIASIGNGQSTADINIGNKDFAQGQSHEIVAWTSDPNNSADEKRTNDTLTITIAPGLEGNYTIGGINPDYETINTAVEDLLQFGVCDDVIFNVRDGFYNEQFELTAIKGTSENAQVTFQGENLDASAVVINFSSNFDNNYLVNLNNAHWVNFRHLTFESGSSFYSRIIHLINDAGDLSFDQNIFKGSNNEIIYSDPNANYDHLSFTANEFISGSTGIYLNSSAFPLSSDLDIAGNTFKNQNNNGIYIANYISPSITGNTISTNLTNFFYGINVNSCTEDLSILSNQIYNISYGRGIFVNNQSGTEEKIAVIANNFIHFTGQNESYGLHINGGNYLKIIYNSVNIRNTAARSRAFYNSYGNNKTIINNIYSNRGGGYAIYFDDQTVTNISDYNDLYTEGEYLGYYSGTDVPSFDDWKQTTSQDSNSVSAIPIFIADTSFHAVQIELNGVALPDEMITSDLEGDPRDAMNPDIGADEFDPPTTDAGLTMIRPGNFPFPAGTQDILVEIKNFGLDDLQSTTVNWTVDNVLQPTVEWSGTLVSGTTEEVSLGNVDFVLGEPKKIKAWTSLPNNIVDLIAINDSIQVDSLYAGLGGDYTIGGSNPDFISFSSATTILNYGGVYDAVTFEIRPGTYEEQLIIHDYPGADSLRPVEFISETGDNTSVTHTFNSTNFSKNFLIQLDGASWLSFKNFTFLSTGNFYNRIIEFTDNTNHIYFDNLIFNSSSNSYDLILSLSNYYNHNISITNSTFERGSSAINLQNPSDQLGEKIYIADNEFNNQSFRGINLLNALAPDITKNKFTSTVNSSSYYAIYASACYDSTKIVANRIYGINNGYGIFIYNLSSPDTEPAPAIIANNFIQIGGSNQNYGIYSSSGTYKQFLYNTIRVANTNVQSSALYVSGGVDLHLLNNIFVNEGGGYAIYSSNFNTIASSDHNDFFITGDRLAYQGGSNITTLQDWQLNTGFDLNSIGENPIFRADTSYQVTQISLDGTGLPTEFINTDIEDDIRDAANPDIGADEFDPPTTDAGLIALGPVDFPFASGEQNVRVILKNFGTGPLLSATINWDIDGQLQSPVAWEGTITSNDTIHFSLGTIDFVLGTGYDLKAWTAMPNGMNDGVAANDTVKSLELYAGLGGTYTVGGTDPDFSNMTTTVNVLNKGGVYDEVFIDIREGTYQEQLVITDYPGSDSTRMVTFQAETSDTGSVVITHNGVWPNYYTLKLDDADYLIFKYLVFETTPNFSGYAVEIVDGSRHNTFENNVFRNQEGGTATLVYAHHNWPYRLPNSFNKFINNTFFNGQVGLNISGLSQPPEYEEGLVCTSNKFMNQNVDGIFLSTLVNPIVQSNDVSLNNTYYYSTPLSLNGISQGGQISGNILYDPNADIGIYLNNCQGTEENPFIVSNNFVSLGGSNNQTVSGISVFGGNYQKLLSNSVNITSDKIDSRAIYFSAWNTNDVLNNIMANQGGGYAFYVDNTFGLSRSDHNAFYSTGNTLFTYGFNQPQNTLEDWINISGMDSNSVVTDPLFSSDRDLHTTNVFLDKKGTPTTEVIIDIDGDTRDPIRPDIGADEFSTTPDDASIVSINHPRKPFAASLQPMLVTILNNGLDTMKTVMVDWEVNGERQLPFQFEEILLSGQSLDSVNIGSYTFDLDVPYTLKVWVSNPNGRLDGDNFNDTLRVDSLYAALGGIYTLGGTTPDYESFDSAIQSLTRGGVIDDVTFSVRDGLYNEQLSIPSIAGASSDRTIIFLSENADSTSVRIEYLPTSEKNYVVRLDGASWVRFEKIGFEALEGGSGRIVELRNGAHHNVFTQNKMVGIETTSSSSIYAIVFSENTQESNNHFRQNRIENGSYAFNFLANSTDLEEGNVLEGNHISGQGYHAIDLQYQTELSVFGNEIDSSLNSFSYIAIQLNQCRDNSQVIANNLHDLFRGRGIYIISSTAEAGNEILLANNFVQVGTESNEGYGIELNSSNHVDVYHNNVNITSTNQNSFAFRSNFSNSSRVLNNVFVNSQGGPVYVKNGGSINVSNFNDLFTTGGVLGNWEGTLVDNLSEWKTTSGLDANSISIDPLYTSYNDLHVHEVDLNASAFPLPNILTDIDGESRNSSSPDRGADEFIPIVANDAGVVEITTPSTDQPFADGELEIFAAIKNNGFDTINTVTVQWKINNNNQPGYAWTGVLLPGARDTILLGSFNFVVGVNHEILAYTDMPDGMPDGETSNDTLFVTNLYPGLLGTYTIGGNLPDFNTLGEAVNALNNGGVLGSVTFDIRDGLYEEQVKISEIKGVSETDTVVFQSENMRSEHVTIRYASSTNAANYVIRLDGSDYVTIRHLKIVGAHPSHSTVIDFINGANHNRVAHNILEAENNITDILVRSHSISLDENNTIYDNQFYNGGHGVLVQGQGNSILESGNLIAHNLFQNQQYSGIYALNQEDITIHGNEISSNSAFYNYFGILCSFCDGSFEVVKNKLTGSSGSGLRLDRCDGNVNERGLVANNFIHVGGSASSYGIYTYYGSNINLYYNSVNITSTNPNSSAIGNYYSTNINIINNILANQGGGYAFNNYSSFSVAISNYNDLFTTGPNLGIWNGSATTDLAAWQTQSGEDANSFSVDPLFTSLSDLHSFQPLIDSMGINVPQVTDDIDGDPRNSSHPDIGADEFMYLIDDTGITNILTPVSGCDLGSATITVRVQNYSGLDLSGFDLAYQVNNESPVVENIGAVSIAPGTFVDYSFSTNYMFSESGTFLISAYTLFPGDTHPDNDTTHRVIQNATIPAPVTNMIPADGISGLTTSIAFSWQSESDFTNFDLYIWVASEERPEIPSVSNITGFSSLYVNPNLDFGELYNWQVVSKNEYCETDGPIQTFRLVDLPDLEVVDVQAPTETFSGRTIEITWEVQNSGEGSTGMSQWTDAIYLSEDPILDLSLDPYLAGAPNISALEPGQSYTNSAEVVLPEGLNGTYYFFVWTDRYNYTKETDNDNNTQRSPVSTITLTPPPDLQVSSILAPSNVFSGSEIEITWTIINEGSGDTRSQGWQDRVYLNNGTELDLGAAVLLGQKNYSEKLNSDSTFTTTLTANLPVDIFGEYYIIIETDVFNQEFEFANEGNNTRISNPINITLKPPPDLLVSQIMLPSTVDNETLMTIEYTVLNQNEPATGTWYDQVYLSSNGDSLDLMQATVLATQLRVKELSKGETYSQQIEVNIPAGITGAYYIYVHTDFDDRVFEYTQNSNNVGRSALPVIIQTPDLVIDNILTVSSANSGDSIEVSWDLENVGTGGIQETNITHALYVLDESTMDTTDAFRIALLESDLSLASGATENFVIQSALPNGISGDYVVHIFADYSRAIYEIDEANNSNSSNRIEVTLSPWIDFVPETFEHPLQASAGELLDISYIVRNTGTRDSDNETWVDKIFISTSSIFNQNEAEQIRFDQISRDLKIDSTYSESRQISIPVDLITGNYYLHLFIDAENEIYEHQSEGNNVFSSPAILITGYPAVDLAVQDVAISDNLQSGQVAIVTWTVRNIDENPTISGGWLDALYLSSDTSLDNDDILLEDRRFEGALEEDQSYMGSLSAILPNGISGDYYLLVVNDYTNINNDYNRANNIGFELNEMGQAIPAPISLTPSSDLIISAIETPSSGFSGQPLEVSWTVRNSGEATTSLSRWTDRIYLSDDLNLDRYDRILITSPHNGFLQSGEEYTGTAEVSVPLNVTGNKIIIIKTDVNNVIYEHGGEDNNTINTNINFFQPPPADLRVISASAPASALAGESVAVSWTVKNQGENPAIGWMKEALYLSEDPVWDEMDELVGSVRNYINLPPENSVNHQLTIDLKGVTIGNYFVIIRTDVLNNFAESDETNNDSPSNNVIQVDVSEIVIGQLYNEQLENGELKYYRIEVPAGLKDETLLLTLRGDSLTGNNEIFLSYNDIPSKAEFDYSFGESFAGNQEIIVPELSPGTYYLLVTGNTMMGNIQDITLLARILNFEVRRVNADEGGNTGSVTVLVDGSKFEEGTDFTLMDGGTSIVATSVIIVDRTQAYATFNLRGQPVGNYDLEATKPAGESATRSDAFEIISGEPASLATNILRPSSTRPGRIITIQVEYENNGNVDIVNPTITVTSLAGAPIALDQKGLQDGKTSLDLSLVELNGPPGILRPGALGTITIYAQATAQPAFMILIPDLEFASLQNN